MDFENLDGSIWMDGVLVPANEARIHVLSHSLHFASSVFEGLRVYNREPFKLREHMERFERSAALCGYALPYSVDEMCQACHDTVAAQGITDGYIRPIAWRGAQSMAPVAVDCEIHVAVAAWEWPIYYSEEAMTKGITLCVADWRRPAPDMAPVASKASGLYQICTLAKHAAMDKGFDDALMYCYRGFVAETTSSNVFFAREDTLHTPTADCFLDGITRQTVIELADRNGITCHVRHIHPDELSDFDECFVTGTAAEITPVQCIGNHTYTPGDMTKAVMAAFNQEVRG